MRGMSEGVIPKHAKTLEGIVKDLGCKFPANIGRPIRAMRIDHDQFIDPMKTF
jgi:hypothetical protein